MHCPGGNATVQIWRVLASSLGISSWTPLKPQHSNPNPNPFANHLWCSDFLTPPIPLIIPHRLPAFLESLMPLNNWCLIQARWSKTVWSIPYVSVAAFFPSLKHNFIAYLTSSRPDCILEIQQLWQSDFRWVYSNCCCNYSFEPEIIKIGQSSHMIYSNNILNFQESTPNLNAHTKNVWKLIVCTSYVYQNIFAGLNNTVFWIVSILPIFSFLPVFHCHLGPSQAHLLQSVSPLSSCS